MTPEIELICVSNVFIRIMKFKNSGDVEMGHAHPFDHVTFLSSGSLDVEINGVPSHHVAPSAIFIAKDVEHKLTALEPSTTACCIHALRIGERVEDIINPESIPKGLDPLMMPKIAESLAGPVWVQFSEKV